MNEKITLTLRVTPERAIAILNRLYGSGELSREKYLERVAKLVRESDLLFERRLQRKESKFDSVKKFYNK